MRYTIILFALVLCGCESEEEAKTKYMAFCTTHDFTAKQCEVLYLNKRASENAEAAANSAAFVGGAAIGMTAGSMGGRR